MNLSLKKLEESVNWNWVGLIASAFTLVITLRNLQQGVTALKQRKGEE